MAKLVLMQAMAKALVLMQAMAKPGANTGDGKVLVLTQATSLPSYRNLVYFAVRHWSRSGF